MANKKHEISAKNKDGDELSLSSHSTDTPVLPSVEYLKGLEELNTGSIQWILEETSNEAKARRDLDYKKIRTIARGQVFGLLFGTMSLIATCILAYLHADITASIVGGSTIVTIVIAFIAGKSK